MFLLRYKSVGRVLLVLILALLLIFCGTVPAQAYYLLDYAYYSPIVSYKWESGIENSIKAAWQIAMADWADTDLVSFNSSSNGNVKLGSFRDAGDDSYGWMGPVNGNDSPASASALSGLLLSPRY